MRYTVTHITTYQYQEPVAVSHNLVHLGPLDLPYQQVLGHQLVVSPEPTVFHKNTDYFGNHAATITVQTKHRELVATATTTIDRRHPEVPAAELTPAWETVAAEVAAAASELLPVLEFAYASAMVPADPAFREFAEPSFTPGRAVLAAAIDLNHRIFSEFTYDSSATTVTTPVQDALLRRRGVCQDFALILIGGMRAMGIPARYVSGYLETTPPPGRPRLVGADASHAWAQVWTGSGWVDLDPTNDCLPGDRHLTVAFGRDFADVSPLRGMILGGGHANVRVSVDVARI
jgi:transglutaminase-like putative cysteine protease